MKWHTICLITIFLLFVNLIKAAVSGEQVMSHSVLRPSWSLFERPTIASAACSWKPTGKRWYGRMEPVLGAVEGSAPSSTSQTNRASRRAVTSISKPSSISGTV